MAKFKYIAARPDGVAVKGSIEATHVKAVLNFLASQGWKPINIKPVKRGLLVLAGGFWSGGINITDRIFLSRYLALMLSIGTGLLQAVTILIEDLKKPAIKNFLTDVRSALERGQPFHSVFDEYEKYFGQVYVNLVKAGEASGNLEQVFRNLVVSLSKEKKFQDDVRGALTYPIILLISSILILFFLVTFSLPKIAKVFLEGGFNPPVFSRFVFAIGLFFGDYGFYIFGIGLAFLAAWFILYKKTLMFKKMTSDFVKQIPVVRDLVKKMAIQRFAATLSSLIKAGISLTDSLEITADVVGHIELKQVLIRVSREGLDKGLTVGDAFKKEKFFPQTIVNLIAVSEKAGHTEEVLATLADFYESEVDNSLKTLVSFLEPVMLFGIGFFIGFIALAVIVPIFQLTSQF